MVCGFDANILGPVLVGGMAGKDGGDVEDDGSFLESQGVLGSGLMSKRIVPGINISAEFT
jgi:hypothetical protein